VGIIIGVTADTILRCARVRAVLMARIAGHASMASCKRKSGIIMIDGAISPIACAVTGGAIHAQGAVMNVIVAMTGGALPGRPLINAILMTGGASGLRMLAVQRKPGLTMIDGGVAPAGRVMTVFASTPKGSLVDVLRAMAEDTFPWRSLVNAARVTIGAEGSPMPAHQRE
jgi:hypothetical protein